MSSLNYRSFLVVSVAAALFLGCGESEDLGAGVVAAECDRLFRCAGEDSDTAEDRLFYGSERACTRTEAEFDITASVQAFIDDGTIVFDRAAADRCLAAFRATCSSTVQQEAACDSVFLGQVAAGGGCLQDEQCVSGVCSASNFDQCGVCIALIPTAAPCDFGDACADGPNGEQGFCNGELCDLFEDSDAVTEDATAGMECDDEQLCAAGLYCLNGTCAPWRVAGDACDPGADSCMPGTFCVESEESFDEGTCVRVRVESVPGADCGLTDTEVVACDLAARLFCNDDENGVCALFVADGEEGEDCELTAECLEGLTCQSGICVGEPAVDGTPCRRDVQCQSGNCRFTDTPPFEATCQPAPVCE